MTNTEAETRPERRSIGLGPTDVGTYHPGLARVEQRIIEELAKHDEWCRQTLTAPDWLVDYSLAAHCAQMGRIMTMVSEIRERDQRMVRIGRFSGICHDVGKLDESCLLYRKNRGITAEEKKQVGRHPHFSVENLWHHMRLLRTEDWPLVIDAFPIIQQHHVPWEIRDSLLREIGFDLHWSDIFLSRMEDRERPGLSQFESIGTLLDEFHHGRYSEFYPPFAIECMTSIEALTRLFGSEIKSFN